MTFIGKRCFQAEHLRTWSFHERVGRLHRVSQASMFVDVSGVNLGSGLVFDLELLSCAGFGFVSFASTPAPPRFALCCIAA